MFNAYKNNFMIDGSLSVVSPWNSQCRAPCNGRSSGFGPRGWKCKRSCSHRHKAQLKAGLRHVRRYSCRSVF